MIPQQLANVRPSLKFNILPKLARFDPDCDEKRRSVFKNSQLTSSWKINAQPYIAALAGSQKNT